MEYHDLVIPLDEICTSMHSLIGSVEFALSNTLRKMSPNAIGTT